MVADGVSWKLLTGGALSASAARVYCTNPPILTVGGTIAENTLGLVFGRHIDGGMHEDVDIINYGPKPVCFSLELLGHPHAVGRSHELQPLKLPDRRGLAA